MPASIVPTNTNDAVVHDTIDTTAGPAALYELFHSYSRPGPQLRLDHGH